METMTAATTDKRIDDLRSEMAQGFAQTDHRFDRVEGDIRELRTDLGLLRADVKGVDQSLRAEIRCVDESLRAEIKAGDELIRAEVKEVGRNAQEEARALRQSVEALRTLMIRFFAGTLGSIVAGVVIAVLGSHFWG